jgi:opacity protein-like surface antigen
MIKKSLILVGLLIGTNSMAQNYFVGVDYSQMKASTKASGISIEDGTINSENSGSGTYKLNANRNLNLKFGIDNIAHGRTYIKVGKLYNKNSVEYSSLSANYDYYINKYNIFTPYIGAGIGKGKFTKSYDYPPSKSATDLDYTARVGSIIDIQDNLKAEIGYQYTKTKAETEKRTIYNGGNGTINEFIANDDVSKIKGFYISLNYGF